MNAALSLLLCLYAQIVAPSADAQAKAKAQALLKQGTALYARGDFAAALDKFEAAYGVFPSPKLQFNIGQTDRDLGRPVEALVAFEKFLALAPNAEPDIVAEARQSVAELHGKLGRVKIAFAAAGVEVTVDGTIAGTTPLTEPIWTTPGAHQVALRRPGAQPVAVTVAAGATTTVALDTPPAAPAPVVSRALGAAPVTAPADGESWWGRQRWYAWTAAGATVALGAGAVAAGLSGNALYDRLQNSCGGHCTTAEDDPLRHRAVLTNVLIGLTAAAAITTGVIFYVDGQRAEVAVAWRLP